jgi:membrane protease YdiL (CAAX protease family)
MTEPDPAGRASAAYRPETPWPPVAAVGVALAASLAPLLVAGAFILLEGAGLLPPDGRGYSLASPLFTAQMILGQLASLGLVWLAAGWRGARTTTLRLAAPRPGWLESVGYGLLLVAAIGPVEVLLYRLAGVDLFTDGRWLLEGLRSPHGWAVAFAAVVLAPLWEEVAFRGFLLSALAKTRLGFWPAALAIAALWTFLHAGYSWPGLASVFLAGIGLSWIMQRTGSLRAVVVAHAVINAVSLTLILLFAP